MSERDAFTGEQWQALLDAAPAIARAVASVSGRASATPAELGAFVDLVAQTELDSPGGVLGELVSDLYGRLAGGLAEERAPDPYVHGVEAARRAGAILAVEADPLEKRRVTAWLLLVADRVAQAGRESGLLGLGGERVSRQESDALGAIRDALGLAETEET